MSQEFDNNILHLGKQKGFYPYEYVSDFEKFTEELPSKEKFYSSLTGKKINDNEYKYVLNFWNQFEMKTMKDYHDMYLKWDILLLADVFEKFRNNSWKNYGLCPSHYLTTLALSWDAILKGIRGGVSYISNRYSKTNSKYLKFYDPEQQSKHVIYLDTNISYGYALSKFLPTSGFKWIDPKKFDLNKYTSNSSKGCVSKLILNILKSYKNHTMIIYLLTPDKIQIKRNTVRLSIKDYWSL